MNLARLYVDDDDDDESACATRRLELLYTTNFCPIIIVYTLIFVNLLRLYKKEKEAFGSSLFFALEKSR